MWLKFISKKKAQIKHKYRIENSIGSKTKDFYCTVIVVRPFSIKKANDFSVISQNVDSSSSKSSNKSIK